ncbi:MAG: hypothetical protein ABJE95_22040 [Byssovorax sp.]
MKNRRTRSIPLAALAILCFPAIAAAADEPPIVPVGCVESQFCDGEVCRAADSSVSVFACEWRGLDPTCGEGECAKGSYCEGGGCAESGMCYPPGSLVSQVMCAGAELPQDGKTPEGCGAGACADGRYCDACGCESPDSVTSQVMCGCGIGEASCGLGECVDGTYCEGPACEGACHAADSALSLAMCGVAPLESCEAPKAPGPGECKGGVFCDAERCYAADSLVSKLRCGAEEGNGEEAQAQAGASAQKTAGAYDVGVIPKKAGKCPSGSPYIQIHMDDEDDGNDNYHWGWVGATSQDSSGTTFGFCRVDGSQFQPLCRDPNQNHDLREGTYAVLKLGSQCPVGSVEFSRSFDNEDDNNQNWSQSNIGPNVSNSNTTLRFCMILPSSQNCMGSFPAMGIEYGVFATSDYPSPHWLQAGYVHTDDEDHNNADSYGFNPQGGVGVMIHDMVFGAHNTELRLARVTNATTPCLQPVHLANGGYQYSWYDGANCYFMPIPSGATAFVWSNSYYVNAVGPNHTCAAGSWDGAHCYIGTPPPGTTAFLWGNSFYYAE